MLQSSTLIGLGLRSSFPHEVELNRKYRECQIVCNLVHVNISRELYISFENSNYNTHDCNKADQRVLESRLSHIGQVSRSLSKRRIRLSRPPLVIVCAISPRRTKRAPSCHNHSSGISRPDHPPYHTRRDRDFSLLVHAPVLDPHSWHLRRWLYDCEVGPGDSSLCARRLRVAERRHHSYRERLCPAFHWLPHTHNTNITSRGPRS